MIDKLNIKLTWRTKTEELENILKEMINKQNEVINLLWGKGLDLESDDVDVDPTTGHDYQCNINIVSGHPCDCFRNPEVRKKSEAEIKRYK